MESITAYLQNNTDQIYQYGVLIGRILIGTVLVGLTLACFYFIYFLYGVLKLQKGSRQYYELRQHIMLESLIRYSITIGCIFTIDILILNYFQWGLHSFLMGLALCSFFFVVKRIVGMVKQKKKIKQN